MGFARARPILQGERSGRAAGDADDGFRKGSTHPASLRGARFGGVVACGPPGRCNNVPNERRSGAARPRCLEEETSMLGTSSRAAALVVALCVAPVGAYAFD